MFLSFHRAVLHTCPGTCAAAGGGGSPASSGPGNEALSQHLGGVLRAQSPFREHRKGPPFSRRMKVPEAPSTFMKMAAFYQCIRPEPRWASES